MALVMVQLVPLGIGTVVPRPNQIVGSGLIVRELVFSGFSPAGNPPSCPSAVALYIHTTEVGTGGGAKGCRTYW